MTADMMERSALSQAQREADQARMMVMQAQHLQPMIPHLNEFRVPEA